MAQIPFVRETIENLLIKVKAVLAANNCASAFSQNNLKNKNLFNEEILTQVKSFGHFRKIPSNQTFKLTFSCLFH